MIDNRQPYALVFGVSVFISAGLQTIIIDVMILIQVKLRLLSEEFVEI